MKGAGGPTVADDAADESDARVERRMEPAAEPAFAAAAAERDQSGAEIDGEPGIGAAIIVQACIEIGVVLQEARVPAEDNHGIGQKTERNDQSGDRSAAETQARERVDR